MTLSFDQAEYRRWLGHAEESLVEARSFAHQGLHHWAAFAAQQSAEAALKALLHGFGKRLPSNSMKQLCDAVASLGIDPGEPCRHAGRVLERHFDGARYPDEYAAGIPRDHYDSLIAEEALESALLIGDFVRRARISL